MSGGIFKSSLGGTLVLTEADFADEVGPGLLVEGTRPASGGGLFKAVALIGLILVVTRRGRRR